MACRVAQAPFTEHLACGHFSCANTQPLARLVWKWISWCAFFRIVLPFRSLTAKGMASPVSDLQWNLLVAAKVKNTDTFLEGTANEWQNIKVLMLLRPSCIWGSRETPPDCSGLRQDCRF
jgi:hypothetical protein